MKGRLPILDRGNCEPFKAVVHGVSLGLVTMMGLYNAAAWLQRRERHLAVNAVLYGFAIVWERRLVAHHIEACRKCPDTVTAVTDETEAAEELRAVA